MNNRQPRLLCIEDEKDIRELIVSELTFEGYEVLEAADGLHGLKMILSEEPDLVLCDISMPGMTGYEVLRSLRGKHKELAHIPFIFLSAHSSAFLESIELENLFETGADDYLTKPVDYSELLVKVRSTIRQAERVKILHQSEIGNVRNEMLSSTMQAVQKIVGNCLENLQLFQMEAAENRTISKDSIKLMNKHIQDTAGKLSDLAELEKW